MHKKLFIPGPVEVRPDVLEQMAKPMIGHRSKEASAIQRRISDNLRKLFFTESEILLSTTYGRSHKIVYSKEGSCIFRRGIWKKMVWDGNY